MVEILPGTGIYITMMARLLIFNMASSRIDLSLRLFKNFYTHEQMLIAGNVGNLPDSAEIIPAIIGKFNSLSLAHLSQRHLKD